MQDIRLKIVAGGIFGIALLLVVASFFFIPSSEIPSKIAFDIPFLLTLMVGIVIVLRASSHTIGWVLAAFSLLVLMSEFAGAYSVYALVLHPDMQLPLRWFAAWIQHWFWLPGIGIFTSLLPQIFPTGRPMSGVWKPIFRLSVVAIIAVSFVIAFVRIPLDDPFLDAGFMNPYGFLAISESAGEPIIGLILLALPFLGIASMVVRIRRSRGEQRQQIKWVLYALGLFAGNFLIFRVGVLLAVEPSGEASGLTKTITDLVDYLIFLSLPMAVGASILKYRLYSIDLIIKRSLIYAILTALLALIYFLTVLVLQQVFPAGSALSTVLSTLAIATLFSPLRRRIQNVINRRFYRQQYDAQETLARFSSQLKEQVDLEQISKLLLNVTEEVLQPEHASLWLRNP